MFIKCEYYFSSIVWIFAKMGIQGPHMFGPVFPIVCEWFHALSKCLKKVRGCMTIQGCPRILALTAEGAGNFLERYIDDIYPVTISPVREYPEDIQVQGDISDEFMCLIIQYCEFFQSGFLMVSVNNLLSVVFFLSSDIRSRLLIHFMASYIVQLSIHHMRHSIYCGCDDSCNFHSIRFYVHTSTTILLIRVRGVISVVVVDSLVCRNAVQGDT